MLDDAFNEESLIARDMCSSDLSYVVGLESNAHISPWGRLSFEESLNREDLCRVIEYQNEIVGYHISSSVADELHVLNVVSAPPFQGRGIGHRLMRDVIECALRCQVSKIFLEVRRSNEIAKNLYLKWQFKQIAVRKNYYRAQLCAPSLREDALVFVHQLGSLQIN